MSFARFRRRRDTSTSPAGYDRRPGNVVLRRARIRPEIVRIRPRRQFSITPKPWMLVATFAVLILFGAFLLALPISSTGREWTSFGDSLFTSVSAVCVTGLVRLDTANHWSGFGEAVILVLIQAGGLGVTMYAGALILIVGRRLGLRGRRFFGMELVGTSQGASGVAILLRRVMIFTVVAEVVTFLLLLPWFIDLSGGGRGTWQAFFHAISAFNNAGFDLMGDFAGFTGQIRDPYPIMVMGVAALLGSLSFLTVFDLRRRRSRWSLDTRFVVVGMGALMLFGTVVFAVSELGDGVLGDLGAGHVLTSSFFLSVNRTTGMTTVDISQIGDATTALMLPLMFIGGASTSTASGIKIGSFMVVVVVLLSAVRGRSQATAFGRELPEPIVLRAIAITGVGLAVLIAGVWALEISEDLPFLPLLFEVMSGAANVGWSQGVTPVLSTSGAYILIVLMFIGRLGPLMVALSVPDRPQARYRYPTESIRIG